VSVARATRLGADRAPSPWALPRLIGWWGFARLAIYTAFGVYFVLTRELRIRILPMTPAVPLSDVEVRWLVACLMAPYLGFGIWSRVSTLYESGLSRMLPGLSRSLRDGLRFLVLGLGGGAGGTALLLGAGPGEAVALAAFTALAFFLGYGLPEWDWSGPGLLMVFLILPLAIYFFAPGLPGSLGGRYAWATAAVCIPLAFLLFRGSATPRFRPSEWPPGPPTPPDAALDAAPVIAPGPAPDPAPHAAPPPGYRPGPRPPPGPWPRDANLVSALPAGAWARAPLRTAYRCWHMEAEGNIGISPLMKVAMALPLIVLIVALIVGGALYLGSTHLLPPLAVATRLALLAYPGSLSLVPLSRRDRAHLLWVSELFVSWGLVAAFAAGLGVAWLLVPEQFASGLSGPHPVLVLGIMMAFFPLVGALGTCMSARRTHRSGPAGWWTVPAIFATGILAILLIVTLPLGLSMYLDQVMTAGARREGAAFLLATVLGLHVAALGALRWYHARSDLAPLA